MTKPLVRVCECGKTATAKEARRCWLQLHPPAKGWLCLECVRLLKPVHLTEAEAKAMEDLDDHIAGGGSLQ